MVNVPCRNWISVSSYSFIQVISSSHVYLVVPSFRPGRIAFTEGIPIGWTKDTRGFRVSFNDILDINLFNIKIHRVFP